MKATETIVKMVTEIQFQGSSQLLKSGYSHRIFVEIQYY